MNRTPVFSAVAIIIALAAIVLISPLHAEQYPRWAGGSVQISGYDTTAYFSARKATEGRAGSDVAWNGGTWRFASADASQSFRANPKAFAPQFGAYCTGGLSQKHVVNGNPVNWRIHQGKLYLFYAAAGARRFDKDPAGTIARARAYAKTVGIVEN